jgi:phage terminase large subunit
MNKEYLIDFTDKSLYVDWIFEYTKALYNPDVRYIFLQGSAGAGKSVVVGQLTIQEVLDGLDYVWIRKIHATLRDSVYANLKNIATDWELEKDLEFQKSLLIETKSHITNKGKVLFKGLDDPEKIKSIVSPDRIVVEEASEISFEDFLQLNTRLRGKKNQKLICLFNPISDQLWLKTKILDNPDWIKENKDKMVWIKKTVLDNKFADKTYIDTLKSFKNTNERFYKIYFLNEWGSAQEGIIFENYKIIDNDFIPEVAGLDFGYNDPTALVYLKRVDKEGKPTLQAKEMIYKSKLTANDLIQEFEDLQVPKDLKIIADSSRPEIIEALVNAGYWVVSCKKYSGSVYEGVVRLQGFDLEISSSPNLTKELQNYYWKNKKGEIMDTPEDGFDHGIDALRYGSEYYSKTQINILEQLEETLKII